MDEGPYRQSGAIACPRCATSLAADAAEGSLSCSAGCGAWYPPDVFAEELGPVLSAERAPSAWWKQRQGATCPVCKTGLEQIVLGSAAVHRCDQHGTWLDRGTRAELEQDFADVLARHRAALALAGQLATRDAAALREVAARLVDLEHRVGLLEAYMTRG